MTHEFNTGTYFVVRANVKSSMKNITNYKKS